MMKNEGKLDRTLRVIVGLIMLSLCVVGPQNLWGRVGLVGLAPLLTGLLGYCPLYHILGLNTCPLEKNS